MTETVQFRGTRSDISRLANLVGRILSGTEPDQHGIAKGFALTLGFAALSDIKDAYVMKSRGGTDEMGVTWPKLSQAYVAYHRRFGPGEKARLKQAAGLGRAHRTAPGNKPGLLTKAQLKRWRGIYSGLLRRFMLSEGEREAKSHAARIAWSIVKKEGAKTMLEVFGNRQVEILRDTGVLLNSLSPGQLTGSGENIGYLKPGGAGGSEQIMEAEGGHVIVGTNVAYASRHQRGGDGVPARPFLPDEQHPVPRVWWERWLAVANRALVVSVQIFFRRAA